MTRPILLEAILIVAIIAGVFDAAVRLGWM